MKPSWCSATGSGSAALAVTASRLARRSPSMAGRFDIIGVMPEGFHFPTKDVQHWEPATLMSVEHEARGRGQILGNRQEELWRVVGRLAPGARVRDAQTQMDAIGRRLSESYPPAIPMSSAIKRKLWHCCSRSRVERSRSRCGRSLARSGWCCSSPVRTCQSRAGAWRVAGTRARLRAALGAGRGRLMQQLLIESSVIAVASGFLGLLGAAAAIRVVAASITPIPRLDEVRTDGTVLIFMVSVSVLTGLLFGIMPAWKLSWVGPWML